MPQDSLLFAGVVGLAVYLFMGMNKGTTAESRGAGAGAGSSDSEDKETRRALQKYKDETLAQPPVRSQPSNTARTPEPVVAPQPAQADPPVPRVPVQESTQRAMSPLRERVSRTEWPDFA